MLRLLALPWLTVLVQVWIHWEALRLVSKGIGLFPHPTGATTTMTRAVEAVATPIIGLLQWVGVMSPASPPASDDTPTDAKQPGEAGDQAPFKPKATGTARRRARQSSG